MCNVTNTSIYGRLAFFFFKMMPSYFFSVKMPFLNEILIILDVKKKSYQAKQKAGGHIEGLRHYLVQCSHPLSEEALIRGQVTWPGS